MQIPAKIFEYMAMQRPMVVIGGEGATADLVADKGLGVVCPDVVDDIASLLEDIVNGRRRVPAAGSEIVAEFVYQNLTRRLVGIFDDAVAEYAR
jgi:glycosyltransferase involved in cell wall biosynthesis